MANCTPIPNADMDAATDCSSTSHVLQNIELTLRYCNEANVKTELESQRGVLFQRQIDLGC